VLKKDELKLSFPTGYKPDCLATYASFYRMTVDDGEGNEERRVSHDHQGRGAPGAGPIPWFRLPWNYRYRPSRSCLTGENPLADVLTEEGAQAKPAACEARGRETCPG